jgi:hypothetical protein
MPSRRALLTAATGLATAGLAGCTGSDVARHYLDVLNGTDAAHTFAVTALDADDAVLFDHDYDLDQRSGDENRVVDGTPARVEVAVDGGDPVGIPWEPRGDSSFVTSNPDGCGDATTTSLTIWYGKETDATLEQSFGCETVR